MNYYTVSPPPQEKKGILARLRKSAALRGKNGFGYRFLRDAVAGVHKENTPAARNLLKTSLFRYFIGFAATERFFPFSPRYEYRGKRLYHLADVRDLNSIRENGLLPNNGWVYLTDDVDLMLTSLQSQKPGSWGETSAFA